MTKEKAYREAKKRWGSKAFVRMSSHGISSPEKRAAAREQMLAARAEKAAIEKELSERLLACDWYQDLMRRKREARKREEIAQGNALYERFAVGEANGMFSYIVGSGDTFEQAFAQADARRGNY